MARWRRALRLATPVISMKTRNLIRFRVELLFAGTELVVKSLMIPVRLHKIVRESSGLSRRDVERAWRAGRLQIQGVEEALHLDRLVFEKDVVLLDGIALERRKPGQYLVFHKPE